MYSADSSNMKSVAVIGGGISGLAAAIELSNIGARVVLYERDSYLGDGITTAVNSTGHRGIDLGLNFMVYNPATYPNVFEFFKKIEFDTEESDLSFSVSSDEGDGYEWGTKNGFSSLFAQKSNMINPNFWQMLREISKFKEDSLRYLEDLEQNPDAHWKDSLDHFVKTRCYSDIFKKAYLVPICCSVWPDSSQGVMGFSAYSVLLFFRDHHLFQPFGHSQGLIIRWCAHNFIDKVRELLESKGCQIRTSCEVHSVSTTDDGCVVTHGDGIQETYDECIMGVRASSALKLLQKQASYDETRVLGAFQYLRSDISLHRDTRFMPVNPAAWSTCNFHTALKKKECVTCWLNTLQRSEKEPPYLVTLNPSHEPKHTILKWSTGLLLPTIAASKASLELDHIQGKRGIWFCRPYQGYGFSADELKAGIVTAHDALRKSCTRISNTKHIATTSLEAGARILVTRFLKNYISTGCLILLEEGGTVFTFCGTSKKCPLKTTLIIHSPLFYWKIATEADLGLADAYIHGDFSLVDRKEGLVNLFMILIANRATETSSSKFRSKRLLDSRILPIIERQLYPGKLSSDNPERVGANLVSRTYRQTIVSAAVNQH